MYIDKLIKKEIITLLVSVSLLVVIFIGVTYAKFLSIDNGKDTVINVGDLSISFCNDSNCDSTYSNIGQVIGTKVENGATVPASIYPYSTEVNYSNATPYIFKVKNTGTLDSTVKIKLKEDATFVPSGDYTGYSRLTTKYADHLKVAIRKRVLYKDTGYQLGDVNMDGFVNKKDIDILRDYSLDKVELNATQMILGDVDCNNGIDVSDILTLTASITGSVKFGDGSFTNVSVFSTLDNNVIYSDDIIKAGEEAIYFVWLYLDNTTPNDVQKTFFVGNLDVVGEYIPVVKPISFSTDSWETIAKAVKEGNIDVYSVGDTREIDLGDYGTHTLRIANTSTPSECSAEGFSQTACGFVLEFTDLISKHNMNDENTNTGGWPATSMRTFLNNDIYNLLPVELQNEIIDTTVVSGHGSKDTDNFTSTDKLYLLSGKEIYKNFSSNYDTSKDLTRQLDYYKQEGVTTSNYGKAAKKYGSTASWWWLRSAGSIYSGSFSGVYDGGGWYYGGSASSSIGVSPAFRIG